MTRELRNFVFFLMLCSSGLVLVNFFVDPLQYYRKSEAPRFVKNQRYQIPGLIRNYSFDAIIVGTSHSENFLASELDKLMPTKSLNLSISGSSAIEQAQVIEFAASQKTLKTVLWEMNYKSFAGNNPNLLKGGKFPLYLYKPDYTTPFYYLYSLDTLLFSLKNVLGKGASKIDGLNSWAKKESGKFDGEHVVEHYCQRLRSSKVASPVADYRKNLSKKLAPVIRANTDADFYLFVPPLSIANYALNNQIVKFTAFREVLYGVADRFSNAHIIDFSTDISMLSNLNNYKDVEHYSIEISSKMLETMASRSFQIDSGPSAIEHNTVLKDNVTAWIKNNPICNVN